ncbi:MAG TPA: dihydrolipoyl dehydrogenase [Candidatus Ornithocaccomicrobium faecavium]|uniref:Dihydrolipoyl dehydrogenase n=1 Tax=Candidatus Ornithocaccomicrobium faecavium TaxID=2840890 RepID=A0A9D1PAG0_9FIRM|nr:dihydrolipoyl dehydrogenase [Candidatus Ornithocaccomicrobium faecavium]
MYDLIILGGGPAGYLAAERAGHAKLSTCLFEMNALGGVCLNEGCIPSKALLYSAKVYDYALHGEKYGVKTENASLDHKAVVARRGKVVRTLVSGVGAKMKGAGVTVVKERASIVGRVEGGYEVEAAGQKYQAKRLLIATGSSPSLPPIPGLKEGIEAGYLLTNREVLTLDAVPERLAIIGGGVIGLEMAAYYATAGSKVTVIEMLDHIAGATDREISAMLQKEYEKKGVTFLLSTKVVSIAEGKIACEAGGKPLEVPFDKALVSIGRRANIKGIGLENLGVVTDRAGIVTDDKMRTSVENVYATGDVTGRYMLAHTAYRESEVAINTILGKPDHMRYNANPSVIYTQPEVASVGLSEEAAKDAGIDYEVKKLSMRYAGRFVAENEGGDGICKILVDKKHRNILGVHMLGSYSSEIIWGAAEMIENELRVTDAREIIFPHPTVSEIIRETLWEFDDK